MRINKVKSRKKSSSFLRLPNIGTVFGRNSSGGGSQPVKTTNYATTQQSPLESSTTATARTTTTTPTPATATTPRSGGNDNKRVSFFSNLKLPAFCGVSTARKTIGNSINNSHGDSNATDGESCNTGQKISLILFIAFHIWLFFGDAILGSASNEYLSSSGENEFDNLVGHLSTTSDLNAKSLHAKWKLWHEMSPSQQSKALKELQPIISQLGKQLVSSLSSPPSSSSCESMWTSSGGLQICTDGIGPSNNNCHFISYGPVGKNKDSDFEFKLGAEWNCQGFIGDALSSRPSKPHPKLSFHNIAINTLQTTMTSNAADFNGNKPWWWKTSIPNLQAFLNWSTLDVLRIGCEGCELGLARDILQQNAQYLSNPSSVKQVLIASRVNKGTIGTMEELYYFGVLLALLQEGNYDLQSVKQSSCDMNSETLGCLPQLEKWGYKCGTFNGKEKSSSFHSCHNLLFKKKN